MEFQGTGRPLNSDGMDQICDTLRVTAVEVWAVLTVETRGFGFLSDRRPQILFERHVFHKLTGGAFDAIEPGISQTKAGGYVGGAGEYGRLDTAMNLDRPAALKSASWGIGQVMGFNHKAAGFTTVEALIDAMVQNETSQLLAMSGFIEDAGLDSALRKKDWEAFARGYNGKDFKKNEYDTRLAAAHAKCKILPPDLRLRSAQAALVYVGLNPGPVDGVPGRLTRSALLTFQGKHGLPETGNLSAATEAMLVSVAFPAATV
jgi:hypothetical protein